MDMAGNRHCNWNVKYCKTKQSEHTTAGQIRYDFLLIVHSKYTLGRHIRLW